MSHPNLSADGTITFDAFIGRNYTFGFAGDFGGGSLAVNFVLDGVAAPFPNSPLNGPGTFTAVAPGSQIQLVLSGSTDPDIEFSIAPVNSETPAAIGAITPAAVDAKIAAALTAKANLTGGNTFSGTQNNSGEVRSTAALSGDTTQLPNVAQADSRYESIPLRGSVTTAITVNNTTTFADITPCMLTNIPAGTYEIEAELFITSADNTSGTKFQITGNWVATASALTLLCYNNLSASAGVLFQGTQKPDELLSPPTSPRGLNSGSGNIPSRSCHGKITGILVFSSTGDVGLQFAQQVAHASNTTCHRGTIIRLRKV
jgi:hypothetical protein